MDGLTEGMTALSSQAFDAATTLNLSSEEAGRLLMAVPARRFADILTRFSPEGHDKQRLVEALCQNDPSRKRDSMDKKVRGWLSGKYQPTAREDLLELCFVLKLGVEDADAFLATSGDEGLHWRNPRELTYAYALRKGMSYPEAAALYARVKPPEAFGDSAVPESSYTPQARQEAVQIETEEALKRYLYEVSEKLGAFHNRAYQVFSELMDLLERPESAAQAEEEAYTTRRIVETYLDRRLPADWDKARLDEKRRCILAGWPDEATLSRMKNRKADVTRKVLMLLFLASDGGEASEEDWPDDEDWDGELPDETNEADDAFRSSYLRMNQMLAACGYRMLDPRSPFDWIGLYCMRVGDDPAAMEGLGERLSQMLDCLFAPEDGD